MFSWWFLPAAVLLFKFASNLFKYLQCRHFLNKYEEYVEGESGLEFNQAVPQIVRLFEDAGIEDQRFPAAQPAGYGMVSSGEVSVLQNITHKNKQVVLSVVEMFHRAVGVYRSRMWETFNPIYWIECVIYLPRRVVTYLGGSADSIFVKVSQVLYWLLTSLLGVLYALFKPEIDQYLRAVLQSLLK